MRTLLLSVAMLSTACVNGALDSSGTNESNDEPPGTFTPAGDDASPPPSVDSGTPSPSVDSAMVTEEDTATPPPSETPPASGAKKIIAYFAAWSVYGRNFHIADIDASLITHLNYAFLNISGGECVLGDPYADIDRFYPGDSWDPGSLRGSFHQLQLLKGKHPSLKTLLSIGGWTWSDGFASAAATAASREKFARSCIGIMTKYGFDGLDLDWEYPGGGGLSAGTPADKENFTLLLAEIRKQLDTTGKGKLLTIATGASPKVIANMELAKIHAYLDSINVMTYDFHGGWEKVTGHNAPLYMGKSDPSPAGWSTDGAVSAYLAAGVPAAKIVVGAAFYGRGWSGVSATNNGLYQAASGTSPGTHEPGILDYHDIVANYLPTFTRKFDSEAKVPWLYSAAKQIMVSYDDVESHNARAQYIKDKGLGGAMIWELSGDTKDHALGKAIKAAL
jgi:chitinase